MSETEDMKAAWRGAMREQAVFFIGLAALIAAAILLASVVIG